MIGLLSLNVLTIRAKPPSDSAWVSVVPSQHGFWGVAGSDWVDISQACCCTCEILHTTTAHFEPGCPPLSRSQRRL